MINHPNQEEAESVVRASYSSAFDVACPLNDELNNGVGAR